MPRRAKDEGKIPGDPAVIARFKPFSEADIRPLTDARSFEQGAAYERSGQIYDTVLRGQLLQARSHGQSGGPYRVEATLVLADAPGMAVLGAYSCSCPRGGFCKHVVALLLAWLRDPGQFAVRDEVLAHLNTLDRDSLLALLHKLLERTPDLDEQIERLLPRLAPVTTPGTAAKVTINTTKIQRQAAKAFQYDGGWQDYDDDDSILDDLIGTGNEYAAEGQWANAAAVYTVVAEETMLHYEQFAEADEYGLVEVLGDATDGLAHCLLVQATLPPGERLDAPMRAGLIKTLYDLWLHGHEYGWDSDSEEDIPTVIAHTATPGERTQIEILLRAKLRNLGEWGREPYVRFIIGLKEQSGVSEAEILSEYQQAGLYSEVAARMIAAGRVDEALGVAQEHLTQPVQATQFAERLLQRGGASVEQGFAFVEERLASLTRKPRPGTRPTESPMSNHVRDHEINSLLHWLEQHYIAQGRMEQAFAIAQRRFEAQPSEQTYTAVKNAALLPGQPPDLWTCTRPHLLADLEAQALWGPLITIRLGEGQVRGALDALQALEAERAERPNATGWSGGGYGYSMSLAHYQLAVAQAAEARYPAEALQAYQGLVETHIAERNRGSYSQAADHLVRVQALYSRLDRAAEWPAYLTGLRTRYKALRALKAELDARGLTG